MILDPLTFFISLVLYVAGAYSLYLLFSGLRNKEELHNQDLNRSSQSFYQPFYTIFVPVKNEAKVVGRLLDRLVGQDYPKDKFEIIVIEDGSKDDTLKIVKRYESEYGNIKLLHFNESKGKPSSLNKALPYAKGDVICVFDADAIPPTNSLSRATEYLQDQRVDAIQGIHQFVNGNDGLLAKAGMFEGLLWHSFILRVKDSLNLFVPLCGSGMFIKRHVFSSIGGWDDKSLTEDADYSVRMLKAGFKIKHVLITFGHETPSKLGVLFKQRVRWYRGYFITGIKHLDCWKYLDKKLSFDILFTLLSPLVSVLTIIAYFLNIIYFFNGVRIVSFVELLVGAFSFQIIYLSFVITWILLSDIKNKLAYIMMSFLSIPYFFLLAGINIYMLFSLIFKRSINWAKTEKTGGIDQDFLILFSRSQNVKSVH
jgi:cellulose synthase/poly-beta-1,6-N-acetylglucosamine synthase-like glycosyltransferase